MNRCPECDAVRAFSATTCVECETRGRSRRYAAVVISVLLAALSVALWSLLTSPEATPPPERDQLLERLDGRLEQLRESE